MGHSRNEVCQYGDDVGIERSEKDPCGEDRHIEHQQRDTESCAHRLGRPRAEERQLGLEEEGTQNAISVEMSVFVFTYTTYISTCIASAIPMHVPVFTSLAMKRG